MAQTKRPSKALLERAVKAAQLYCGSLGLDVRRAQRLYNRMFKVTAKVAAATGMDHTDAASQIEAEARRRGCLTPTPGKDY